MKRIVFSTFLLALLLIGGKKTLANGQKITIGSVTNWDSFIKDQENFNKLNPTFLLIKYTDFDLEEEFSSNTNYKDSRSNKLLPVKFPLIKKWYLSFDDSIDYTNDYNLPYNCELNFGPSTPIYLFHSVLRI
ncbi:hypothetical protein [Flavobacterium cellulosilyticum]|uniref:Uncharacterized protein n=1 Tax=Flavobacterium cellulosilyticum TaxID=2541731 RepID=A0A4R5C6J0_9FLAO|nr:hypothetical protein [Flavobacterium cellulosilyticum]TDD93680.1 hypothetical protein E0F76_18765 [Flavobacterium cellulosilyticum]